jgi:tripartite-type tricarboxylate transporter receptor subunit TctC
MNRSLLVRTLALALAGAALLASAGPSAAAWEPKKPVEFIATAGPGGGTDIFARTVQGIITKHKLISQPVVVVNKAGGSGAEGHFYGKSSVGDPYKVVVATSNTWQLPMVTKLAYKHTDFTPIAALVQDEFLLWVKQDAPYQSVHDYLKAVAARNGEFRMGGANAKDTDEILTRVIEKTAKVKFTYIPFKRSRTSITRAKASGSGAAARSGRFACSTGSDFPSDPSSRRRKAGTTSRRAWKRGSIFPSTSNRARCGCRPR